MLDTLNVIDIFEQFFDLIRRICNNLRIMRIRRSLWKLNLVLCYLLLAQLVFTIDPPPPGTVQSLAGPSSVTTATQNTTDGNPVLAAATVNPIPNPSDGSVSTVDANANTNTAPSASVANTANEVGTNRIENTNVVNTNDAL